MRVIFAAAVVAAAATCGVAPASAQAAKNYAFCSVTSGIGTDCIYDNLAQCQQDIQGNGGFCKHGSGYDASHPLGTGEFPQPPNQ
jgi:hypothetical protein